MSKTTSNTTFDQPQFEALFKTHFKHLCNFALQYVGDLDTAQDICQTVVIKLWESREKVDPSKSIKSFLFTAVKNRCLNYIRDNKKFRSKVLDLDCGDIDLFSDDLVASEPSDVADLKDKIAAAMDLLPEKCRLVFEMSRYQNMKYKEIAEELAISQKTVEAHMSKAIKTLKVQLKDYYFLWILLFFGPYV